MIGTWSAVIGGIVFFLLAGSFFNLFDQALSQSQVFNYTKSITQALTLEMVIYISGGVGLLASAGILAFGAFGTLFKKVSCQECGKRSALPAEPALIVPSAVK